MKRNKFYLPHTMRTGPLLDRFTAFIIDMMVLMMIGGLLASVGGKLMVAILTWLYFTLCHGIWGYTIGKKAVGLRVISASENSVTWPRWLLRETIGRILCSAFFCAGYLRALLSDDRRGWHDMIAGTLVVTEKKHAMSFVRATSVTLTLFFTFTGIGSFLILKTSLVGNLIVARLQQSGHTAEGLRGSPLDGWSLAHWRHDSPQSTYSLRGIKLDFSLKSFFVDGTLHIKNLQVAQAEIIDKGVFENLKKPEATKEEAKAKAPKSTPLVESLLIEKINIGKVDFSHSSGIQLTVNQFFLSQLQLRNQLLTLSRLHLNAEQGQFDVWDSKWDMEKDHITANLQAKVQPSLHKTVKSPFAATISFQGKLHSPELINIVGFDNRLMVKYSPGVLHFKVKGFSPGHYFNAPGYPISRITMAGDNVLCEKLMCFMDVNARGSFYLRHRKFNFENFRATAESSSTSESLKLQPVGLITSALMPLPVFSIATERELEDYLTELYFGRVMRDELTEQQLRTVSFDTRYFNKYLNRPENVNSDEYTLDPALMVPGRRPTSSPAAAPIQPKNN